MKRGMLNLSIISACLVALPAAAEVTGYSNQLQAPPRPSAPVQNSEVERAVVSDEYQIGKQSGSPEEVRQWLQHYDMVVVIDKATQRLNAYGNTGLRPEVAMTTLMSDVKVSTGREQPGCHQSMSLPEDGVKWVRDVIPMTKHTPVGYYVPSEIDADHWSGTFEGAEMKNAIAWDRANGFWIHQTPTDADINDLGHVASHGCIRLSPQDSRKLMTMGLMTGPDWTPNDPNLRAHCFQHPDAKTPCQPSTKLDRELNEYLANIKQGNYPSFEFKSQMPRLTIDPDREVLMVSKNGTPLRDANGNIMRKPKGTGYNMLFIVKDSRFDTKRNQLIKPPQPPTCPKAADLNAEIARTTGRRPPAGIPMPPDAAPQFINPFEGLRNLFTGGAQTAPAQQQVRRAR